MRKKILEGLNYGDYEISGQSLVYNNSLDIGGKFLANPNVTFTKENGIITITKEAGYIGTGNASSVYTKGIDAIVGDKYIFIAQIRTDTPNGIKAGGGYGGNYFTDVLVPTSSWETYGRIFTANSTSPYQYLYIFFSNASGVSVQYKNIAYINLTLLEQALGTTINTLDDFYATPVGQQVKKGVYLPYSPTNTILNAEFPIRVVGENLFGNIQWKTGINYAYSEIEKPEFRLAISLKKGKTMPSDLFFGVDDTGDWQQGVNAIWLASAGNIIRENISSLGFPYAKKYIAVYPSKYKDTITEYLDIMLTEGTSPKPYVKYIDRTIDVGEPLQLRGVGEYKSDQLLSAYSTLRNANGIKIEGDGTGKIIVEVANPTNYNQITLGAKIIQDHTYLIYQDLERGSNDSFLEMYISGTTVPYNKKYYLAKSPSTTSNIWFYIGKNTPNGRYECYPHIHDLTALGLENLTLDQLKAQRPDLFEYEPYHETETRWKITDTYRNTTGKKKTMVGEVDLGSLNWEYQTGHERFRVLFSGGKPALDDDGIANIMCSEYKAGSVANTSSTSGKTIDKRIAYAFEVPRIYVRDTVFGTDPTSFKNAMSGVILNYELATPTTDTYSSYALPKGITKAYDVHGMELYIKEK